MEVPSRTEVKILITEITDAKFKRMEIELIYLRKMVRKLEEEILCLKNNKFKLGKNQI